MGSPATPHRKRPKMIKPYIYIPWWQYAFYPSSQQITINQQLILPGSNTEHFLCPKLTVTSDFNILPVRPNSLSTPQFFVHMGTCEHRTHSQNLMSIQKVMLTQQHSEDGQFDWKFLQISRSLHSRTKLGLNPWEICDPTPK